MIKWIKKLFAPSPPEFWPEGKNFVVDYYCVLGPHKHSGFDFFETETDMNDHIRLCKEEFGKRFKYKTAKRMSREVD